MKRSIRILVFVILGTLLMSCGLIDDSTESGEEATATTEAPAPTESPQPTDSPPDTEAPPATEAPPGTETSEAEEGDSSEVLLFGGLVLLAFLLVGVLIGRSRNRNRAGSETQVPAAAQGDEAKPTFKDQARDGYSESRWLLDSMTEELAIWRGNAQFDGQTEVGDTAATAMASNWAQLETRMAAATSDLYRAEASAPDQNTAGTLRATITALNAVRAGIDARAEARLNSRNAEGQDLTVQAEAADRERLSASNLSEARQQLTSSLVTLSALL
jgi:hypothetical protein